MYTNTINTEQFSALLKENEEVHELITTKDIGILRRYPELKNVNQEFLDWLSPQYFDVFTTLFDTYLNSRNEAKLVKLVSSPLYCNEETKEKIIDILCSVCRASIDQSAAINKLLVGKRKDVVPIANAGGLRVLNHLNIAIFANFDHPKLNDLKDESITLSFLICEKLKKRGEDDLAYPFFEHFVLHMPKLTFNEQQQKAYNQLKQAYDRKNSTSETKNILVLLLRIIGLFR